MESCKTDKKCPECGGHLIKNPRDPIGQEERVHDHNWSVFCKT